VAQNQKYLGKKLSGDLRTRAMVDLQDQRHIAWMKFNEHRGTVRNQHVSLRLRFKFFDSAITPTNLFGFLPCPLASNQFQQVEVVKERMLRSIVGWTPLVDKDGHALMQRTKRKLESYTTYLIIGPLLEVSGIPTKGKLLCGTSLTTWRV